MNNFVSACAGNTEAGRHRGRLERSAALRGLLRAAQGQGLHSGMINEWWLVAGGFFSFSEDARVTGCFFFCFSAVQKLREDLENKLSMSLATMEQELRKCVFDERGSGLVYLQNTPADEQVRHFTLLAVYVFKF